MGATEFSCTAFGKNVNEAFNNACLEARYDHGHSGYTGTIAEKAGYHLVVLKDMGLTYDKFHRAFRAAEALLLAEEDARPDSWEMRTKRHQAKLDTRVRRARAKFDRLAGTIGYSIREIVKISNDKWGPAVAVKLTGKIAKDLRARHGLKGRKGDFFEFFGLASC